MPLFRKPGSPYQYYDFYFSGKRYRGSTKEKTVAAGRTFERKLMEQLEAGIDDPKKMPTLRQFFPRFLAFVDDQQQRAFSTKRGYRNGARLLNDTKLAHYPLNKITTSLVATVSFPGGPANGNQALRTLSRLLNLAVEWNLLRVVPRIHLYREQGRTMLWTPEYERAFLEVAPQPVKDVFILMMNTGMRPAEIFALRWEDILWDRKVIHVVKGKTLSASRYVGLTGAAEAVLRSRASTGSAYVFPGRKGTHVRTVAKAYAAAHKIAGLPPQLKLYCARHTAATELIGAGVSVHAVAKSLGHTSTVTTNRYIHPSTAGVAEVMDQVNAQRRVM